MALHFDFSPDQRMMADGLRRRLGNLRALPLEETALALGSQGLFGVMLPEDAGGLGLGLADGLALAIEIGRAGLGYPAVETMAAMPLLTRLQPDMVLDAMAGRQIITLAASGTAKAKSERGRLRLSGEVTAPFAQRARWLALSIGHDAAAMIDLASRSIRIEALPDFDPAGPLGRVSFDLTVKADSIPADELGTRATILACGDMTGAAELCLERSVQHLRERVQFGRPLGANQVLRHTVADDWLRVQGMQAACEYAAAAHDANPHGAAHAVSVAKAYCSQAARKVAESAIHIHGGIGFAWDAGLHLPLRRILRLAASYGTAAEHLDLLAGDLFAAKSEKDERTCSSSNFASM